MSASVTAAPPDAGTEFGVPRRWLALAVVCFTMLLITLDQTILNVALPTLVKDLHPSSSGLQWIADSYTLTNAVFLLFGGALGDRFGRRRLFLIGALIFGGGSLGCALVHSTGPLIAARAVMGLGAAFLMPATLSIITVMFSGQERAQAIGIWAGVGGIGAAAGPILGGWLLQHFWWGSVFLINVPVAVIAVIGGLTVVTESRAPAGAKVDPIGVVLSALGLTALIYGLIEAPTKHWTSPGVLGSFALAVVLLVGFVLWDRRDTDPLLDFTLFANRTFSSALAAITASFFALFGVSYLLSQYVQFVQGANPLGVGIRFLPLALGTLLTSNVAARLTARFGLRRVMLTGMTLLTCGLALFITLSPASGYTPVGIAFALIGLGLGLAIAPASNAIMGTLPSAKIGSGSGLRGMVQLLGGTLGVAVIGSLATTRYRSIMEHSFTGALRDVPSSVRGAVGDQVGQATLAAGGLPAPLARATRAAADRAFLSGLHLSAIVGVAVMLVAIAVAAAYIPDRAEPRAAGDNTLTGVPVHV